MTCGYSIKVKPIWQLLLNGCFLLVTPPLADPNARGQQGSQRPADARARASTSRLQVELLLEGYLSQLRDSNQEAASLLRSVQSAQEVVELALSAYRNRILTLSIRATIGMLGLAASTLVGGMFGMNLTSGLESDPTAFFAAAAGSLGLAVTVVAGSGNLPDTFVASEAKTVFASPGSKVSGIYPDLRKLKPTSQPKLKQTLGSLSRRLNPS